MSRHHTFGERKIKSLKQEKNMVPWFMATSPKKKIVPQFSKTPSEVRKVKAVK